MSAAAQAKPAQRTTHGERLELEAKRRREVGRVAEEYLEGIPRTGVHHVDPNLFRVLVAYIFEGEPELAAKATKRDRFKVSNLEFVCDRALTRENTLSLVAFARMKEIPHPTVSRHVAQARLKFVIIEGKKRYLIHDLNSLPFIHRG